ncbi:trypsin-like peptidase domain-containing protein [Sphingobium fluviale]|uniref:FHA domain-containing protein n=1 Tax=Sphingobium fluviale TaxID=2506423 RepID=A0A4Q1KIA9_9SPHN|nr:trypsin-like peptidase domain-containing protein [Sphingobium fluviale]RXR29531.1 FHA domain-containing protein [Sphingobium fluviale]
MLRRFLTKCAPLLALLSFFSSNAAEAGSFDYRRVSGSVVYVAILNASGKLAGHGSGFIVAPGIVVTNHHVSSAGQGLAVVPNGDDGSHAVKATVLHSSPVHDLAVLSAPGLGGRALPIASGSPALGVPVWAMGFPGLADVVNVEETVSASLTYGTVSRVFSGRAGSGDAKNPTWLIQHSAQIAPGNSGGPLFDQCHRVVGINTQGASKDGSTFLFSVASRELVAILKQAGVAAKYSGAACGDTPAVGTAGAPDQSPPPAKGGDNATDALPETAPAQKPDAEESARIQAEARDQGREAAKQARQRAAAARAAQRAAEAASNEVEAKRQARIAEDAERTAEELEDYTEKLDKQLEESVDPLERYTPIALGSAGVLGFGGLIWWLSRRRKSVLAKRASQAALLSKREKDLSAQQDRDVVLDSAEGAVKLPGIDLERGVIVGRSIEMADVVIPKEEVSREHARFTRQTGRLFICDMGSANGLFLNGRRLTPNHEEEVRNGDRVSFGPNIVFTCKFR